MQILSEPTPAFNEMTAIRTETDFRQAALRLFHHQYRTCAPYRQYVDLAGIRPEDVQEVEDIPFLPIELFKSHRIYSGSLEENPPEILFKSSGTTTAIQSTHYVRSRAVYESSFLKAFERFYDKAERCNLYALLPSYLEREGSSLIYMIEKLIERSCDGGFFLYNHDELIERLNRRDRSKRTILFGVSFALLDLTERYRLDFHDEITVMETGGMKGRRRELPREELHRLLCDGLGVSAIHSEYGMCECLSQSYSSGSGIFHSPPWMRILVRDLHDPFRILGPGKRGGVNIIDLANIHSCAFIQTEDVGIRDGEGGFFIEGRIDKSDIRGCNLLI